MIICKKECDDVDYVGYISKPSSYDDRIKMLVVSESMPDDQKDYYDAAGEPKFMANTNMVFGKLGCIFKTYQDYIENGIYLTTAIKCKKKDYLVRAKTIENCSYILEKEFGRFVNIKVVLLMGDFAIKAVNYIWKRKYGVRIIPTGSTYKIRKNTFKHEGIRFFPSYTHTGNSFGIEKSKVKMIEDDIGKALKFIGM